ncbi:MAG: hypothetical protein GY906_12790 [bacterium]|nr:hypothetical protein [bacterium]
MSTDNWTIKRDPTTGHAIMSSPAKDERIIFQCFETADGQGPEEIAERVAMLLSDKALLVPFYLYDELSDKAKEAARQWWIEGCESRDQLDPEWFTESCREALAQDFGLVCHDEFKLCWSLSSCQGDGVAFDGVVDFDELLKHNAALAERMARAFDNLPVEFDVYLKLDNSGRYCHWNSMQVEVQVECEWAMDSWSAEDFNDIEHDIREAVKELIANASRKFEREGYEAIEHNQSDEVVGETIEANEYRFTADGSRSVTL